MNYLLSFALSTTVIVHTALYHGQSLINGMKKIRVEPDDIHAKLMRNYSEVPEWWYATAFCIFFGLAIVAVKVCVGPLFIPLGQMPDCVLLCFVGLAYGGTSLGAVTFCTSSYHLYTTFRIHLCHDGSGCMLHLHFLFVQPI